MEKKLFPLRLIWAWPEVRLKNVQFFSWVEQVALIFLSSVQLSLLESDENQPIYIKFKTPKTAFTQVPKLQKRQNALYPHWMRCRLAICKISCTELQPKRKKCKLFLGVLSASPKIKLALTQIRFTPQHRQVVRFFYDVFCAQNPKRQ